jgi:hypothetical protein
VLAETEEVIGRLLIFPLLLEQTDEVEVAEEEALKTGKRVLREVRV